MSMTYDAIVVGTGASGGFAVKELTDQGLNVLALEAGREVGAADFDPSKKKPVLPINIMERAQATMRGQGVQARAAFFRGMLSHFYVNDRDNPYTTPKDAPFVWIRGRQSGGRTHTFGRVLMRWSDDDFRAKSVTGRGVDWPVSYADMAPYYDEVESFLGIYGNNDGLPQVPDGKCAAPAKLSPAEEHFRDAVKAKWPERPIIGWRSVAPPKGRVFAPLAAAQATGRLTVRWNSVARRIVTQNGVATGVEVTDTQTGETVMVKAGHVVLSASPIESLRLLWNSGLGNRHDQLGRYFMDQLPMLVMGSYTPVKGQWTGDDTFPKDPFYDLQSGIFLTRFSEDPKTRGEFDFQGGIGRAPVGANDPAKFLFFGFGQMQPTATNRVTLSRKKDRWGIPGAHITCRMTPEDEALMRRQEETFIETMNGVGGQVEFLGSARRIREWGRGAYPEADPISRFLFRRMFHRVMTMGAAIHETGGARMGTDPETSVVSPTGQLWEVPNVTVTDASTFCGSGVMGTTLTMMAQTVRACRHVAQSNALRAAS